MALLDGRGWKATFRHTLNQRPNARNVYYNTKPVICWEAEEDQDPVGLVLDNDEKSLRSAQSLSAA